MAWRRDRRRPPVQILDPGLIRRPGTNALLASGARLRRGAGIQEDASARQWQSRSFFYYDAVGEVKEAAQFYARGLAPLELFAAEVRVGERSGRPEIVPTENEQAIAALERIQDPGGGRSGLLSSYGRLMFLAGESILFVSKPRGAEKEQWEMLSTDELRVDPDGRTYQRMKSPSTMTELYREPDDGDYEPVNDKSAVAYRLWKRHPRYSSLPDAPMQGALDIAEELLLLTQGVRSRVRSRLAGSGILFIPDELDQSAPLADANDEPDDDPEVDPFVDRLTRAMTTPIGDEGSASAVVPLVVRGAAEYIEKVRHLLLTDPAQLYPELGMRWEAIKRLAIVLDLPPETLLGKSGANHWSAWSVDEDTWRVHLQPVAQQLVDDLSASYFRPELREAKVENADRFLIAYDASKVINHPNRGKDAKDLHDRGALSDEALRESTGFDEDDAPSEPDRIRWIAVHAKDTMLAMTGIPGRTTGGGEQDDTKADTVDAGDTKEETSKEPPAPPDETLVILNGNGSLERAAEVARIVGAADLALLRAREVAGNRLRGLAKRDRALERELDGVRPGQVPATLGRDRVKALGAPAERELVAGCRDLIIDALRAFGVDDEQVAGIVADNVVRHAAATLYDERPGPLPPSLVSYLDGLVTAGR